MIAQKQTRWLATFLTVATLSSVPLTGHAQVISAPTSPVVPTVSTSPVASTGLTTPSPVTPPPASAASGWASLGSYVKIDGRLFAGIYKTEPDGAYPNRGFVVPDAKLRFTFTPNKDITTVVRFAIANAMPYSSTAALNTTTNAITITPGLGIDLLYVDVNDWAGLLPGQVARVGKHVVDFGEEVWSADPEDANLITNSAAGIIDLEGGLNLRGTVPINAQHPLLYSLDVTNDNAASVTSAQTPLLTVVKLANSPQKNLYISVSGSTTGTITGATSMAVANLTAKPTGAASWSQQIGELDVRYNFGPTGFKADVGTVVTAPFQLAGAVGAFGGQANGGGNNRDGSYWFAEGRYNVTQKFYAAARVSNVGLDNGYKDKLDGSPIAVNSYERTSLGLGYSISPLVHLKGEYTINTTGGGASSPRLNQLSLGFATKF